MNPFSWRFVKKVCRKLVTAYRVRDMRLADYRPVSKLVVPQTPVLVPCCPVVDAHNHLGDLFGGSWDRRPVAELLDVLDQAGIQVLVDLDGGWGEDILHRHLDHFKSAAPERFQVFCGVDWAEWPERGDGFADWAASQLAIRVRRGAQGLKIWKTLGLSVRDERGQLVAVDDRRLDALWDQAAGLHIPVLIHCADPAASFDPVDEHNERYRQLREHPEWGWCRPGLPSFNNLIEQFAGLVARHPATTFIGAHVGGYAENLGWVSALLARCPNLFVDISGRLAELGRQPYTARRFFLEHQDRILFGTDVYPQLNWYRVYYRFLETEDEYFDYNPGPVPFQGYWKICGIGLPREVLRKVYFENARRILAGPPGSAAAA